MVMSNPPGFVRRFWRSPFGKRVIHILEPSRWWTVIFGVGAIAIIVWTLTIYRQQARDEATHAAEIGANATSQYHQCVTSIPVLVKINGFIAGDRIIRNTLVENSYRVYVATPVRTMERRIRYANWVRLRRARAEAYEVKFPVPTAASCAALRAKLLTDR